MKNQAIEMTSKEIELQEIQRRIEKLLKRVEKTKKLDTAIDIIVWTKIISGIPIYNYEVNKKYMFPLKNAMTFCKK